MTERQPQPLCLAAAAAAIGINADVLRRHCVAGRVPGAFQLVAGGRWYLPANIVEILQTTRGPALREEKTCVSASGETSGGSISPRRAAAELDVLLGQLTGAPRKNCTTN